MRKLPGVWLILLLVGVGLLNSPLPALYAQPGPPNNQVVVLSPVTVQDHGSTLGVSVPFQLRSNDGRSINNAPITSLQLRLIELPAGAITTFPYDEAFRIETPLYVSLLIDASGSMVPHMDAVRTAAKDAVAGAPENARFRIVSFRGRKPNNDPDIQVLQDFTNNRQEALRAIDSITNPEGATCYYDTVYESLRVINTLGNRVTANARSAVVAFTDGIDTIDQNNITPCSQRSIDEVIREAQRLEIPVYTIGMYGNNPGNIRADDLRRLASETQGLAAIGGQSEIQRLFEDVFAGLVNQYEATFEVLAKPGRNEAFLLVGISGVAGDIKSPPFEFSSPKNYIIPTPTPTRPATLTPRPTSVPTIAPTVTALPSVEIWFLRKPVKLEDIQRYRLEINIKNPHQIDFVEVQVEDEGGEAVEINNTGINPFVLPVRVDSSGVVNFDIPFAGLSPNEEHTVIVQAVDKNGRYIEMPDDGFGRNDTPPTYLATTKFTYDVTAEPLNVSIYQVDSTTKAGNLYIDLSSNKLDRLVRYRVFVESADKETPLSYDTGELVYPPGQAQVAVKLPDSLMQPRENPQPLEAEVWLIAWGADNESAQTERKEIILPPPPKLPSMFEQVIAGLQQNPLLAIGLVVVLSSAILFLIFGRRPKKQAFSLARPVEEYTVIAGAAPANGKKRGKLLVEVVETPSAGDKIKRTVNNFPCIIGRSQECQIRLTGDGQISRQHARLAVENGRIILTDMGSNNGTFVEGQRISANAPTTLSDAQVFQLGRHTKIRVSLQY